MSQPTPTNQPQDLPPVVSGDDFRIPLNPPPPLTKEDGSFDHEKVSNHIAWISHKYRSHFTDIEHDLELETQDGAEIKDIANMDLAGRNVPLLPKRRSWAAVINIGSNKQMFEVEVDTGSTDLWVPNYCRPTESSKRRSYNASDSTTCKEVEDTFQMKYADGLEVSGPVYSDTVDMGSVKVDGQHFSAATRISKTREELCFDGILGLGFPMRSRLKSKMPFIQNAAKNGDIPTLAFALKLTGDNPSINLGGPRKEDYEGDIEYHKIDLDIHNVRWALLGAEVTVNRGPTKFTFNTIIDSGSDMMVGSPEDVQMFYNAFGGIPHPSHKGYYYYPTKNPPAISFKWEDVEWKMENFGVGTEGESTIGALVSADFVEKGRMILGTPFLQNVYSVFDFRSGGGHPRIGFALPVKH